MFVRSSDSNNKFSYYQFYCLRGRQPKPDVDVCSILKFTQRVQLLPVLMFTRTATETRKRALFKYVIKSKLFSKCEYITHSLSISLMTYFRCMQLCHTRSICLTWREIIAAKFHLPSCPFSELLPYFHTHGI